MTRTTRSGCNLVVAIAGLNLTNISIAGCDNVVAGIGHNRSNISGRGINNIIAVCDVDRLRPATTDQDFIVSATGDDAVDPAARGLNTIISAACINCSCCFRRFFPCGPKPVADVDSVIAAARPNEFHPSAMRGDCIVSTPRVDHSCAAVANADRVIATSSEDRANTSGALPVAEGRSASCYKIISVTDINLANIGITKRDFIVAIIRFDRANITRRKINYVLPTPQINTSDGA